jgi:sirohydrochlorin cobaltochelatase
MHMPKRPHSALVITGHGSTLNPDSSAPTHAHADAIRARGLFAEVVCAFWKEEPSLREVLRTVDSPEVFVVPNFISEGYFTQEVIPRELGLSGKTTQFPRHVVHYCDPVGLHPSMTKLLLKRAEEVAPGVPRSECSLIIVGHGTGLNENSTKAIKDQVALIRSMECGFAEVLDAYMEEPPLVADWAKLTTAPNVIVVPFFIADGLHSWQDIPVLLGIESEPGAAASEVDVFRHNPRQVQGRNLYYTSAIGTEPLLADVILDQVEAFAAPVARPSRPCSAADDSRQGRDGLATALTAIGDHTRIGEVLITRSGGSFLLHHHLDAAAENLTRHTTPEAAREIAKCDTAGKFRPLKSAPTLIRGCRQLATSRRRPHRHPARYAQPPDRHLPRHRHAPRRRGAATRRRHLPRHEMPPPHPLAAASRTALDFPAPRKAIRRRPAGRNPPALHRRLPAPHRRRAPRREAADES